jgi:hypothetical protein
LVPSSVKVTEPLGVVAMLCFLKGRRAGFRAARAMLIAAPLWCGAM